MQSRQFLTAIVGSSSLFREGLARILDRAGFQQEDTQPAIHGNGNPPDSLLESNGAWTPELSAREKWILGCLILGDSNKAIARKIDVAEATVKVHIKAILRKIRAQNRTQAAIWAMNNASGGALAADGAIGVIGEPGEVPAASAKVSALLEGRKVFSEAGS